MHKYILEYGPAPGDYEEEARKLFPYKTHCPEQYAAQEGHKWGSFSFDNYIYKDAELNEWIHSLGDIFFTEGAIEALRQKHLTPAELERVKQEEYEDF